MFLQAGCADADLKEEQVRRKDPPNIICTLRGSSDSVIIVGAHTDHVERGQGVVDDWSGAALLPALLESLNKTPRRHTFLFIGFADEEKGLWGSHYYVRHLSRERVDGIRAMVNLECLGLTPTKVWAARSDRRLLSDLILIARNFQVDLQGVNVDGVGDDDTRPFLWRHVPVITIHSVTQQTWPILHSPRDIFSAIHFDDYYDSYRLIAAYLAYLDATLPK
ncbi:MAG TPA: M28 family peptidase [Terriglobia bacterium]|nr:M28 family peptidase [Terriglobia bacterium]